MGLLIAEAGLTFIRAQNNEDLPSFTEINLDWHVFAFAFGVSILSGLIFGLAPARAGAKLDLNAPLKEGNWEPAGASLRLSNGTLTVLQFGLATILLAGAGAGWARLRGCDVRSRSRRFRSSCNLWVRARLSDSSTKAYDSIV